AGKTTTIRMLLGLIRPTQGGGRILGHDIENERAAILPHVGALVESPAFYPILSGRDNLRVFARTAGNEDARTIEGVLQQVGLSSRAQDKVKTYSLGMKQRLAIAAVLLNHPQIIFLDEPTNGLDPAGTVEIRELIGQLGASGHTIFLSSHLLHEVEQVCNEVAIINHGKMVAQGRVADLLKREASLLIEAEPLATLQAVVERFGATQQAIGPRTITVALQPERAPELMKALVIILMQTLLPLVAGTVALMGAVIGRSSVAGIVIGIAWFSIDSLLGGLFPLASLSNAAMFIQARLTGMVMASNGSITPVRLPGELPGLLGLIPFVVVVFYLVVPITVAAIVFRKRDMLGAA
ncbi:MAG TPA: ATP-binding cassette domain-containing protein, partial [Ktedonobacteraceae bacterium]|nr:ATP-binding cassette domain-containing protein [Ktedonobacteraceae bacterium]